MTARRKRNGRVAAAGFVETRKQSDRDNTADRRADHGRGAGKRHDDADRQLDLFDDADLVELLRTREMERLRKLWGRT